MEGSSLILEDLALLLEVVQNLLLLGGEALMDEGLLGLHVLELTKFLFCLFALVPHISDNFLVALLGNKLPLDKELLFLRVNSVHVFFIAVSLREFVLKHCDNVLNLVDTGVDRL